jgi:hypothetical protein
MSAFLRETASAVPPALRYVKSGDSQVILNCHCVVKTCQVLTRFSTNPLPMPTCAKTPSKEFVHSIGFYPSVNPGRYFTRWAERPNRASSSTFAFRYSFGPLLSLIYLFYRKSNGDKNWTDTGCANILLYLPDP